MGQAITCSYKIPESFSGEHVTELDGTTQDDKSKTLTLSIEVETNLPVYERRTIVSSDNYVSKSASRVNGAKINENIREVN